MAQDQDQDQTQNQDPQEYTRKRLLRNLLSRVEEDRYPSTMMLDTIEQMMTPDELPRYTEVLMTHIENDRFPSIPMIERLRNLGTE